MDRDTFGTRLAMAITDMDRKQSSRERRPNIHRLGIMLGAKQEAIADLHEDSLKEYARVISEFFTPTREMHSFCKRFAIPLGVDRGMWIRL